MRFNAAPVVQNLLLVAALLVAAVCPSARAGWDSTRYMGPSEVRPGMKGYGRTVMSGTRVETFDFEVISVMSNAFYAKQDVILIRCSGLKLEHSGIIGGMSGSPCYIKGEDGRDRMIGAVAYGWSFNKDPICGVQPITQMLEVAEFRKPNGSGKDKAPPTAPDNSANRAGAGGIDLGELIARAWRKPIDRSSCFSIFNPDIEKLMATEKPADLGPAGLKPLKTPVMIGGMGHPEVMSFLRDVFDRMSMEPIASGGPSAIARAEAGEVKLEPGSVLCIPLITGDINADALGTCTEVDGDRILGFGHSLDAKGSIRLPLATGMVHTVVPSVMRSSKLGASLKTVGTLWGDESTGIFGVTGEAPPMVPVEVTFEDRRGKNTFHYQVAQDESLTAELAAAAVLETIYAHSDLPKEHTLHYSMETEFDGLGQFRSRNTTSQSGAFGVAFGVMVPAMTLLNSPFGEAKVSRVKVEIKVDEEARWAQIDQVLTDRRIYRPGDEVNARVRWAHYRKSPTFTEETYPFKLPDDLPDGQYQLTAGSARVHLNALRVEKPHLFRAESMPELLARLNQISAEPDNRVFLRLTVPEGGLAVKDVELPDLPSYLAQIYTAAKRTDIQPYLQAVVHQYDLPFAAEGGQMVTITVSRRADQ